MMDWLKNQIEELKQEYPAAEESIEARHQSYLNRRWPGCRR
jgi:hypothetical protein